MNNTLTASGMKLVPVDKNDYVKVGQIVWWLNEGKDKLHKGKVVILYGDKDYTSVSEILKDGSVSDVKLVKMTADLWKESGSSAPAPAPVPSFVHAPPPAPTPAPTPAPAPAPAPAPVFDYESMKDKILEYSLYDQYGNLQPMYKKLADDIHVISIDLTLTLAKLMRNMKLPGGIYVSDPFEHDEEVPDAVNWWHDPIHLNNHKNGLVMWFGEGGFPESFLTNYLNKRIIIQTKDNEGDIINTTEYIVLQKPSEETLKYLREFTEPFEVTDTVARRAFMRKIVNQQMPLKPTTSQNTGIENSSTKTIPVKLNPRIEIDKMPKSLKGHEVRYFKQMPIYITTLPAGTLLFRGLPKLGLVFNDLLGYSYRKEDSHTRKHKLEDITNVFFYPFPFISDTVAELGSRYNITAISVLPHDIKIATMINPSPYTRSERFYKTFVESCYIDRTMPDLMTPVMYDPCFTPEFQKENPDVIGMIAIADNDAKTFLKNRHTVPQEFYSLYSDREILKGIPEIILYPRLSRNDTNTFQSTKTTTLTEIVQKIPNLSFIPYHIMERNANSLLQEILTTGLSGNSTNKLLGFDDEFFIDKVTGFYISGKYYSGDKSRLIKDRSKLSNTDLIFGSMTSEDVPAGSAGAGSGATSGGRRK